MKNSIGEYSKYFIAAVILHVFLLGFLMLSAETTLNANQLPAAKGDIVQAVVIDESKVEQEVQALQSAEQQKVLAEAAAQKQLAEKLEQVKKEREQENAKLLKLKQDMAKAKQEEQERLAEIKIQKEKEKKQLEDLKKEKEKEQKRLAALDDQRQAEQNRVKEMRQEREKEEKKKTELLKQQQEAKRKAEEAKRSAAAKAAAEANRAAAANQARVDAEVNRIFSLWKEKIETNRREVLGMDPELSCEVIMNILPDGSVQVTLAKQSGNAVYDKASINAIYKSVPFQLPEDPLVRDKLKSIRVTFKNDQNT